MDEHDDSEFDGSGADPDTPDPAGDTAAIPEEGLSTESDATIPEHYQIDETIPAKGSSIAESGESIAERGETHAQRIGDRYRVRGLLGRGSMGNVYKVYDEALDEVVALKTLHDEFVAEEPAEERFRREVKLARRVTHPNVARIYDLGLQDEIPYITMEFIDGDPFDEVLEREGPLSAGALLDYVEPICQGLQAAHEADIVHRDLKPQNVMVSERRVVITDFGIARAATQSGHYSISREGLIGTPAYMAPEQVQSTRPIDARTDIYALGVMLYRMLTGTFPWRESAAVAMAFERCERPAPTLPEDGDWPDAYRTVVHRCLQRDPDDRYDEAVEVAAGLRRASNPAFATYGPSPSERDRPRSSVASGLGRPGIADSVALQSLPRGKTLAVLPFEHVGPEDLEYRAAGFTEELLDELSRAQGLAVLPRGAVRHLRDREIDPRIAGHELGVQVVIEGSVQQFDETVHVRVAAISVEEGFQLWADRFEVEPSDLIDLGDEAADAVRRALTLESASGRYEAPADPLAVDLYMRARHEMHERWFSDLQPAIDLFERALDREPSDPRILSGLATARARAAFVDAPNRRDHLSRAEEFAERATDVAPNWPEPHFALAKIHYNRVDFRRALDSVETALDLAPDYAEAHALRGRMIAEIGPLETAARHLQRSLELNPYAYNARWDLARVQALRSQWHRVDRLLEQTVDSKLHVVLRYANRTRFDLWRDDPEWVYADPPAELPEDSDFERLTPIMRRVTRGERLTPRDRETLEVTAASNADSDSRYLSLQYQFRTEIGARAGEHEYALESLERAVESGLVDRNWLESCPMLEGLRDESAYAAAVDEVRARIRADLENTIEPQEES